MQGPLHVDSFEVDPFSPNRMYVTDRKTVMRSTNAGCSWSTVLRLEESGNGPTQPISIPQITSIEVPRARTHHGWVYLVIDEGWRINAGPRDRSPLGRPSIMMSRNGGRSWHEYREGLPQVGRPVQLAIAPSNPKTIFLLVAIGAYVVVGAEGEEESAERIALYRSDDGGESWSIINEDLIDPPVTIHSFQIDPLNPKDLWIATHKGLYHSKDGGESSSAIKAIGPESIEALDVYHGRSRESRIAAFRGGSMYWSQDGGRKWVKHNAEEFYEVESVAHAHSSDTLVVSAHTQIFRFDPRSDNWVDITPRLKADRFAVQDIYCDVQSDHESRPAFYTCSPTTLLRYKGRL